MGTHFCRHMAIMIAAAVLGSMACAVAQTAPPQGSAPPPPSPDNAAPENGADWKNERFERQALREEMEQIRKEHEEMESARDQLKEKCGGGEQMSADCEQLKQALRDRHDQLHERTLALREKIQTTRREHPLDYSMPRLDGSREDRGQIPAPPQAATGQQDQQPAPPPSR